MAELNAFINSLKYQIKIKISALLKKKSQVYHLLLLLQKQF